MSGRLQIVACNDSQVDCALEHMAVGIFEVGPLKLVQVFLDVGAWRVFDPEGGHVLQVFLDFGSKAPTVWTLTNSVETVLQVSVPGERADRDVLVGVGQQFEPLFEHPTVLFLGPRPELRLSGGTCGNDTLWRSFDVDSRHFDGSRREARRLLGNLANDYLPLVSARERELEQKLRRCLSFVQFGLDIFSMI